MMGHMKKRIARNSLIALAACTALTACTNNPAMMRFESESGLLLQGQDFGNSTMNNTQIMSGEKSYAIDLANRFAAEVITTVHFAFNSAQLDAGAQDALREQANWIRQFPEITFRVFGHADAPGSNSYNKTLGLRRAQAVVAFLATQGISRKRLEAVSSLGETQPLVATEGRERRNRRAVTEVSGFVRSHPSVLDGKYGQIIYRDYITSAAPATATSGITGADMATSQ
jgi:peptidoglycan-associated lipoprotein